VLTSLPPRSGKRFIFDKAHSLGVRIIVVDGPDSWARSLVRGRGPEKGQVVELTSLAPHVCAASASYALTRRCHTGHGGCGREVRQHRHAGR